MTAAEKALDARCARIAVWTKRLESALEDLQAVEDELRALERESADLQHLARVTADLRYSQVQRLHQLDSLIVQLRGDVADEQGRVRHCWRRIKRWWHGLPRTDVAGSVVLQAQD